MTSFTTLVNIDAQAANKLAAFIASKLPGEESNTFKITCDDLIGKAETQSLMNNLLDKIQTILTLEDDLGKIYFHFFQSNYIYNKISIRSR
jgi:hypothetical protein